MSKIYKDFEDYASSNGNTLTRYKESHADTWNACQISKQQEIDQLKEQLDYYSNKINVQNYVALTKENTHIKARIMDLENQRKEQEAIIQRLNIDRHDLEKENERLNKEISGLNYWKR